MVIGVLLKIAIAACLSLKDSVIFLSCLTPRELIPYVQEYKVLNLTDLSLDAILIEMSHIDFLFLIDFTFSTRKLQMINLVSLHFEAAYISIFEHEESFTNRIEIHHTLEDEFKSMISLTKHLQIDSYTILSSSSQEDLKLSEQFKNEKNSQILYYSDIITKEAADSIVLKYLKSKGLRFLIIIDTSPSLEVIESSLVSKKWNKPGTALIYSSRCLSKIKILGALQIIEGGTEGSKNFIEYHLSSILNLINQVPKAIESNSNIFTTRSEILNSLKLYSNPQLKIANFKPNLEIIGNFDRLNGSVSINQPIIFPGNTSNFNSLSKSIIPISIANGTHDPYSSTSYTYAAYLFNGATYAVQRSNSNAEIENFEIELFPTDCGLFFYDALWYNNCFSKVVNNLGIGLITTLFRASIKGNIKTLRTLNKVVPNVSPLGVDTETNSKIDYPELVKLEANPEIFTDSRIKTLISLGYKDVVLIGSNETDWISRYKYLKDLIDENGMRIANDEPNRFIN